MVIEIEKKTKKQKICDVICLVLAVICTLLLIESTDDLLGDSILILIPIWITFILVFIRNIVSPLFCIFGIIVSILGLLFAHKYTLVLITIMIYCIVSIINAIKGSNQREVVTEELRRISNDEWEIVINNIVHSCERNNLEYNISQGYIHRSVNVRDANGKIEQVEQVITEFLTEKDGSRRVEYRIKGECDESRIVTSRENIGEMTIKDGYTTVGKVDVKGNVQRIEQYRKHIEDSFVSMTEALRSAQSQSVNNGNIEVYVYCWYRNPRENSQQIIAAFYKVAIFANGIMLDY